MKKVTLYFFLITSTAVLMTLLMSSLAFPHKILAKEGKINRGTNHRFEELEYKFEAHLGVYGIDTGTNEIISFNEDDRFAFASTFKALAGAMVLRDYSWEQLNSNVMINAEDLVDYSPITEKYVGKGMLLKDIIAAAMDYSDNTAGNFLFKHLGGPKGYQDKLKNLQDTVTNSSRYETDLNEAIPEDLRDTSTPKAIAQDLREMALGEQLTKDKQKYYKKLLLENTTGAQLIAAGVPDTVIVGDKSGAAQYGTRHDIAILYPENRDPLVLVIFSNKSEKNAQYHDELISETTKIVSEFFKL